MRPSNFLPFAALTVISVSGLRAAEIETPSKGKPAPGALKVAEGFDAELLYTVPKGIDAAPVVDGTVRARPDPEMF